MSNQLAAKVQHTSPQSSSQSIVNFDKTAVTPKPKIRVLVVDDLKLMLAGLKAIFAKDWDIEIIGLAENGKEAIGLIETEKPDVVVLDFLMPVMGGLETTKEITKHFPEVKILILSSFEGDSIVSEALAAGANGYLLKDAIVDDLAQAIRSVYNGSYHFAPGIMPTLAKAAIKNTSHTSIKVASQDISISKSGSLVASHGTLNQAPVDETELVKAQLPPKVEKPKVEKPKVEKPKVEKPKVEKTKVEETKVEETKVEKGNAKKSNAKKTKAKKTKAKKTPPEKPLFPYGDWGLTILGVIVLSRIDGMGHHLAHTGLFLLMLALIARSISKWWNLPLKHRRAIGILAFAASVAHVRYAKEYFFDGNLLNVLSRPVVYQWGIWAGVISLFLMTPAAITSFRFMQRKLGKNWRLIHLLTVPSLALAVLHTVVVGPHYMAGLQMELIDHIRTYTIIVFGLLIFLLRRRIFSSVLNLDKSGK